MSNTPRRFPGFFLFAFLIVTAPVQAQSLLCTPSATNLTNHAEGLAEPSGDIFLSCSGGTTGSQVTANLTLTFSVPVTNRLNASGTPDVSVTVNSAAANVTPVLQSVNSVALNGLLITLPATIHISNVRLAMNVAGAGRPVIANISTTLPVTTSVVTVATASTGLLATYSNTGISCVGSQLPPTINWQNLFAFQTNFVSTRLTEGFAAAFVPKDPASDAGTRILLTYSGFPAAATVYIPDYVAGNDATIPTAAGDFGGTQSSGAYSQTPFGTLLLARVIGADATGNGGVPIMSAAAFAASGAVTGSVTQVPLTSGAGTATYEVIDANPNVQESAQFPTFIGLPSFTNQNTVIATEAVSLAPVSTITTAMPNLPVPRFVAVPPPSDCAAEGCSSTYFPSLTATTTGLQFSTSPTGSVLTQNIQVNNTGGGTLAFTTSIAYQGTASGWLTITNPSGSTNHTTLVVTANPAGLAQGTYQATVTINGGQAGTQTFNATFSVGPPQITISGVVNAASFQTGPLVAGSLATIEGTNLNGNAVGVSFGGIGATVLFSNATQINVLVPASLASLTSTQVVVTVNGNSSAAFTVPLAPIDPGIFGVLNQDNTVNSATNPAAAGTIVQIFATGLLSPLNSTVIVGFGNQGIPQTYSGSSPNGLQQVNAQLPATAPSFSNQLSVCGVESHPEQEVCSPPVTLYVH